MALDYTTVERLADWCSKNEDIADVRAKARSDFFGYYDGKPVNYVAGTGDVDSRERRFSGYFAFNLKLPDGRRPAELAANALLGGRELILAVEATRAARYVTGVATRITRGRGFYLELEDEEFAINSSALSRTVQEGQALSAHIVRSSGSRYLLAPGWLAWPILPGPEMRSQLKSVFQPNPVEVERFLQRRVERLDDSEKEVEYPEDDTLEAAVARMSKAARMEGKVQLIMSVEEWKNVVLSHMTSRNFNGFTQEICKRIGKFTSVEDTNKWLALATNVWNNTPQPHRGGKSAHQMVREWRRQSEKPYSSDGW
jgi:hypothetical protein